jgi:hypothetical protein
MSRPIRWRDAQRCETAATSARRCRCRCRGAAHGRGRTDLWRIADGDPHRPAGQITLESRIMEATMPTSWEGDRLDQLWQLQAALQESMGERGRALAVPNIYLEKVQDAERMTRENVLAMHAELTELLDSFNWKPWKTWNGANVNRGNILTEVVDLGHFLINVCLTWGITPAEYFAAYAGKHQENRRRQAEGY